MSVEHFEDSVVGFAEFRGLYLIHYGKEGVGGVVHGVGEASVHMEEDAALAGDQKLYEAQPSLVLQGRKLHDAVQVRNKVDYVVQGIDILTGFSNI